MNIKEAKQELLQTIQVYTRKDSNGHYLQPRAVTKQMRSAVFSIW